MGLFSFGSGGKKAAHTGMRNSYFNPYDLAGSFGSVSSTAGFVPNKKQWKSGMRPTPGSFNASLSPEMEALRSAFMGGAMGELGQAGQGVSGYAGITPEMYQEFLDSDTGIGEDFLGASRRYLGEEEAMGPYNFEDIYNKQLGLMRDLDYSGEQNEASGALDTLFGKGILASTPGGYQTEALAKSLSGRDVQRQLGASSVALQRGDQFEAVRNALRSAGLGFGQAGSSDVASRFQRALDMFGTGQQTESLRANRAQGYLGGVGSIDQFLANLMQMGGNLGAQRSGANANAYAPYIQASMAKDQMGADFLGQLMGGAASIGTAGVGAGGRWAGG